MIKFDEIIRRLVYVNGVRYLQWLTGVKPHFRAQYALYLQGPRWYVIRNLRLLWDGGRCVRCGKRRRLEVHHLDYDDKGEGWGVAEFFRLRTVCNECHDWVHGR